MTRMFLSYVNGREYQELVTVNFEAGEFKQEFYSIEDGKLFVFISRKCHITELGWESPLQWHKTTGGKLYKEVTNDFLNNYPRHESSITVNRGGLRNA